VEITSGNLKSGDKLVVRPAERLVDGAAVVVQTK
jgi:hypothetical protein